MKIIATVLLPIIFPSLSYSQTELGVKGGYIYYWFTHSEEGHFMASYDYSHSANSVSAIVRQKIPESILKLEMEIEYPHTSFFKASN